MHRKRKQFVLDEIIPNNTMINSHKTCTLLTSHIDTDFTWGNIKTHFGSFSWAHVALSLLEVV